MNIITEKEISGRLTDGINTLMTLSEEDFQRVIYLLQMSNRDNQFPENIDFFYSTDECEMPERDVILGLENSGNSRYYFGKVPKMQEIFNELAARITDNKSDESIRCKAILETRNLEVLKQVFAQGNDDNKKILDKLFEILENPDLLEKFLDYENNSEYFSAGENGVRIQDYFRLLGKIFGNIDKNGNLNKEKTIKNIYFIPNLDSILQAVKEIYQRYNVDRYVDPKYEFESINFDENVIRDGEEPKWDINPQLYDVIYKDMPEGLSLEEQALYIYTKLCLVLEYNEEYLYRGKGVSSKFESDFSKEHLESIVPGSKITCFDFSRIFAKMVNEIEGDIEAVVISEGLNQGHFSTGFYTDKVSVRLEAINVNGKKDPTNDLMKAKNDIRLKGIKVQSDRENIINSLLNRVYESIYGRQALSIKDFVQELKRLPEADVPDDTKTKLQAFIEVMKEKGIVGNEFVQTLDGMCKSSFFGQDVEKAYIGKRMEHEGEKHIQRMILLRKKGVEQGKPYLYLIDTSTLEMIEPASQQLIEELNSGSMIYESEKHKIAGIDREEDDDTAK